MHNKSSLRITGSHFSRISTTPPCYGENETHHTMAARGWHTVPLTVLTEGGQLKVTDVAQATTFLAAVGISDALQEQGARNTTGTWDMDNITPFTPRNGQGAVT
ncbi:Hypothetical predicted protein [Pelobates cultripes]|uniref:Uncharacterized protein n=1 Tax=Pelobates cultripes TaxID=61616 RepID=A0AAD1WDX1_PELCU|nr:Hypothetical predicted protein [Pelobates cultripes]